MAYGGGLFVAVGDGMPTNNCSPTNRNIYTLLIELPGWGRNSGAPAGDVHSIHGFSYGAGRFVAVDDTGYAYLPTTGTTWINIVPGSNPLITLTRYVNYRNGLFIALGTSGRNFVSSDAPILIMAISLGILPKSGPLHLHEPVQVWRESELTDRDPSRKRVKTPTFAKEQGHPKPPQSLLIAN